MPASAEHSSAGAFIARGAGSVLRAAMTQMFGPSRASQEALKTAPSSGGPGRSQLGVELINNRDIVLSSPESGFSVTYRKDGDAPMLVAIDGIDRAVDQAKLKFWAQAWKAS
jgi:hypothetical protein